MSDHTPHQPVVLPVVDDDPKGDYWAPEVNEIEPTAAELAAGNALGATIDVDNDADRGNGGL